jgi:uncharacterized protein (DUF1697 family)
MVAGAAVARQLILNTYKNIFYLCAKKGIGRSSPAAKVERCLGVPVSARNWNTARKLLEMAGAEAT